MQFSIRPAYDKTFAENLIRQNMTVYYQQLDMRWDTALFDKNWNELDCYELVVDGGRVGILLLNHDEKAYYIRELQIVDKWQRQGIGSKAIRYVMEIALQASLNAIRLRMFYINPAIALYERMGFCICKTESGTHYMERRVS